MLAIIRLRSDIKTRPAVSKTFELLKLSRQMTLVIMPDNPSFRGMVKTVQDYCMWGVVDDKLADELAKKLPVSGEGKLKIFHLHPPRGGFKSIKKQRPHGNLGKQEDITKWIDKMMPEDVK